MLHELNLVQIIKEPTHIHGNTLDIVCVSDISVISSYDVVMPGLSDHCIIILELTNNSPSHLFSQHKNQREILVHRKADTIKFRERMDDACKSLFSMTNVQEMWDTFSAAFKEAIAISVPKETVPMMRQNQPPWFNKKAEKLHKKEQMLYKQYKKTKNIFFLQRYKEQRRGNKKAYKQIKRKYIEFKICKPLEKGNSKPFYKHLREKQKQHHPLATIKLNDGTMSTDNKACA